MSRLDTLASHLENDLFVRVERLGKLGVLAMRHRAPRPASDAALTTEMRRSLLRGLRTLQRDDGVTAILLTSDSPRVFSSGVDRESFGDGLVEDTQRGIPSLAALCEAVESSPKVVVAYVQGGCMSWGLELAMAAPFRVALHNARFAFPEVQLSLVTCGGGAQRLTRLVGVHQALHMLCTGKTVTAREALAMGLIDAVLSTPGPAAEGAPAVRGSLAEQVQAFVAECVAEVARCNPFVPRARRGGRIGLATTNAVQFAWMEHKLRDHAPRNVRAPYMCLGAVRIATHYAHDFAAGLEQERQLFMQCLVQPQCKAMQHVLQSSSRTLTVYERQLRTTLTVRQQLLPFRNAVVMGAGLIGTSVAFLLLQHGLRVTVVEIDAARKEAAEQRLRSETMAAAQTHERISLQEAHAALGRLQVVGSHYQPFPAAIAEADLVVECVPESATVKKNVFAHLDKLCNHSCVFLSCTASMDVRELGAVTQRPQQVLGMQFYPPANVNPMVEVSRTPQTDVAVLRRVLALADKLQKHVVLTQSTEGHVVTRILLAGLYQAYTMLEEGAFPREIDLAMKNHFHFKFGIFELEDMIGLDATAMARQHFLATHSRSSSSAASAGRVLGSPLMPRDVFTVADELVKAGLVGRKRGEGWHKYKEAAPTGPERDAHDPDTPLRLPSLTAGWNPLTWRSGTLLPQGQWHTLLSPHEMAVAHNRAAEHRLLRVCKEKRILRRDFMEDEVVERIRLAMTNEAARLLAAGVAGCAADVDALSVHAFGFPAWQGGLLYNADHVVGAEKLVERMMVYQNSVGTDAFPAPCAALLDMSRKHQTFANTFPGSKSETLQSE